MTVHQLGFGANFAAGLPHAGTGSVGIGASTAANKCSSNLFARVNTVNASSWHF